MLAGGRAIRVGDQLFREIASILIEKVRDPRVEGVTITGTRLSKDLRRATVFFSVIGSAEQVQRARTGLESARRFIKRELGARMELKHVPEINFEYDSSMETGNRMDRLFEDIRKSEDREGEEKAKT